MTQHISFEEALAQAKAKRDAQTAAAKASYDAALAAKATAAGNTAVQGTYDVRGKPIQAGLVSLADAATLGGARGVTAAIATGFDYMSGRNAGMTFMETLRAEQKNANKAFDAYQQQNPVASVAGALAGAFGGGASLARGASAATKLAGATVVGAVPRVAAPSAAVGKIFDNFAGRIVSAGGVGGLEGATYAVNSDRNVGSSTAEGIVWGTAGRALLGSAFWGLGKRRQQGLATSAERKAAEEFSTALAKEYPDKSLAEIQSILRTTARKLGPQATVGDLAFSLQNMGFNILKNSEKGATGQMFSAAVMSRMRRSGNRFAGMVDNLTSAGLPSSKTELLARGAERRAVYKDRLAYVLDEAYKTAGVSFNPTRVSDILLGGKSKALGAPTKWRNNAIQGVLDELALNVTTNAQGAKLLTPADLLSVRNSLDRAITSARSGTDAASKGSAAVLTGLRKRLTDLLSNDVQGFDQIMRDYTTTYQVQEAYDMGVRVARSAGKGEDAGSGAMQSLLMQYADAKGDVPVGVMEALQMGAKNQLVAGLSRGTGSGKLGLEAARKASLKLANQINASPELRSNLALVFGEPTANMLLEAASAEAVFQRTENTVQRLISGGVDSSAANAVINVGKDVAVAAGAGMGASSKAAGIGSLANLGRRVSGAKRTDKAVATALGNSGPDLLSTIGNMTSGPVKSYNNIVSDFGLLGAMQQPSAQQK